MKPATLFALALISVLAWLGVVPAQAHAGDLRVNAWVQGAGTITYDFNDKYSLGTCYMTSNQDERVSQYCGQRIKESWGSTTGTITATPADWPAGHWRFVGWVDCPSPNENHCSMTSPFGSAGNFSPKAVFDDGVSPALTLDATTYPANRAVAVGFWANESLSARSCRRDAGSWQSCFGAWVTRYEGLSEGDHTLQVAGADMSGQWGYSETRPFKIVDTALTGKPNALVRSRTATFKFTTGAGIAFLCRLDASDWSECTSPKTLTVPTDGSHTFAVKALNGGVEDPVPEQYTWTVDTVAPNTTVAAADLPEGVLTTLLEATYTFASSEPFGARFQCKLDAAAFTPCVSPHRYTGLPFGKHKFEVRASDLAGNVDATPAVRNWEIAAKDDDRDGFNQRSDCDDNNPAIHKGAVDVPGNGIDEDCNGRDATEVLSFSLTYAYKAGRKVTTMTQLIAKKLPAGSTIKATCKTKKQSQSKKCPKAVIKHNAARTVRLRSFTKRKLPIGTKLTIRVTKPNAIGAAKVLEMRKLTSPKVTDRCMLPNTSKLLAACG